MNSHQLHRLADRIARARGISHSAALAILGRAGNRRRRYLGSTEVDPAAFAQVEQPPRPYWWQRADA